MKIAALILLVPTLAFAIPPPDIDLGLGDPLSPWPLAEPSKRIPTGQLPKLVPWTLAGSGWVAVFARDICQGETYIRCEAVNPQPVTGAGEWGFRMYRKDTGAYLGTMDRNVAENIHNDSSRAMDVAEQRNPESNWIARKEAEKAQLEYVAASCVSGAVYCTGMASKLGKFKELFTAGCSLWSGFCVAKANELKLEIQRQIDFVKQQCAIGDQACFDAVTGGGETQERLRRYEEKKIQGASGQRPPHEPMTAGRPPFMPGNASGDGIAKWYDNSCRHCKVYEGLEAEKY